MGMEEVGVCLLRLGGYESSSKHEFKGLIREVFYFCLFILFASLLVELFDGPLHPVYFPRGLGAIGMWKF